VQDRWSRRDVLKASAASAAGALFAEPLRAAAPPPTEVTSALIDAARKEGKVSFYTALELNTAGLRKDCNEIYPSPLIVRLAAQMGVPITFASDAHAPAEVGMNFPEAIELARSAGYTHRCRFTQRRREEVKF